MNRADDLRLPRRAPDAHKGHFGRVLIIAGSRGMSGAAVLTTGACLRSGAGLVTVATPTSVLAQIAMAHPAAMTLPLPETSRGQVSWAARSILEPRLAAFDAVAVGPGLGRSAGAASLVVWLFQHCPCPLVLDADALNAVAQAIGHRRIELSPVAPNGPAKFVRVLTPHQREYGRLQSSIAGILGDPADVAAAIPSDERVMAIAKLLGSWIVLKGPNTRMTDGTELWRNPTGNPGLATGGSGDCLTGVMVACLANQSEIPIAVRRAVYVHGLAGDLAAAELGQQAMNAEDLGPYLAKAWKTLETDS